MPDQNEKMLTAVESHKIHKEENRVYFDPKVGLYTVQWTETGNNDIPRIIPIGIKHTN